MTIFFCVLSFFAGVASTVGAFALLTKEWAP